MTDIDPMALRGCRVNLQDRPRPSRGQGPDHPRLRARVVVLAVAAGGEEEREVVVGLLAGWAVLDGQEPRLAVRMMEALREQPLGAGMVLGLTRPEQAVLAVDRHSGSPWVSVVL